jgi:hypothetical protein
VIEENRGYTTSGENPSSKAQMGGKSTLKEKKNNVPEKQVQRAQTRTELESGDMGYEATCWCARRTIKTRASYQYNTL